MNYNKTYYLIGESMVRFFFFLVGFGLTLIGCIYIIIYLNLTTIGYNFLDYVKFIIRRPECVISILGLINKQQEKKESGGKIFGLFRR